MPARDLANQGRYAAWGDGLMPAAATCSRRACNCCASSHTISSARAACECFEKHRIHIHVSKCAYMYTSHTVCSARAACERLGKQRIHIHVSKCAYMYTSHTICSARAACERLEKQRIHIRISMYAYLFGKAVLYIYILVIVYICKLRTPFLRHAPLASVVHTYIHTYCFCVQVCLMCAHTHVCVTLHMHVHMQIIVPVSKGKTLRHVQANI
jgi:hypothetical protein